VTVTGAGGAPRVYDSVRIDSGLIASMLIFPEVFVHSAPRIDNFLTRLGVIGQSW
jgi:hypothetical protein